MGSFMRTNPHSSRPQERGQGPPDEAVAPARRVLIVEDEFFLAVQIEEWLVAAGLEVVDIAFAADEAVAGQPDVRTGGPLNDAKKELAEAWLTLALVRDLPLPGPVELGIEIAPYCNGLAEAASELRRQLLDQLRAGDLARAETLMRAMDEIYSLLVTIDYPDGVTGGLRRTTDALRAVLERTRGDLTTAMVATRLQTAIESAQRAAQD